MVECPSTTGRWWW